MSNVMIVCEAIWQSTSIEDERARYQTPKPNFYGSMLQAVSPFPYFPIAFPSLYWFQVPCLLFADAHQRLDQNAFFRCVSQSQCRNTFMPQRLGYQIM